MILKLNNTDVTDYLVQNGVHIGLDNFAVNGGYTLDGADLTTIKGQRLNLTLNFIPLTTAQRLVIFDLIKSGWITVELTTTGGTESHLMRCTNQPAGVLVSYQDGTEYWDGIKLVMVEKNVE